MDSSSKPPGDVVQLGPRLSRRTLSLVITGAVFVGACLSRSVWFPDAPFHPDTSWILWAALDAVRHPGIPDHGLISTYTTFQPPGLVWLTMPLVALGGGRPEIVIVAFALLNAAAIALLVAMVARFWGLVYAAVLGSFLVVGPDAFYSAWVWHPSLYTGAIAVMLTAGIGLRHGSAWWAALLIAVPGLYALMHYSGFVLFAPGLALLVLSHRTWSSMLRPLAGAAVLVVCAWVPFFLFEVDRDWVELRALVDATDSSSTLGATVDDRLTAFRFAASHLGESFRGPVRLSLVIKALVVVAVLAAVIRRRWRDEAFALPAVMLVSGVVAQVALDQGRRTDVLMLWSVPLYALAAWAVVQTVELMRVAFHRRGAPLGAAAAAAAVVVVTVVGSMDFADSIRTIPGDLRLDDKWRVARANGPVYYSAGVDPAPSANKLYLACDPPYDWGSEIWYLREVLHPGRGLAAARAAGAFRARAPPPCRNE